MYLFVDTGEHDGYFFLLRHLAKAGQVVNTRRVDERDFAHADDTYFGAVAQLCHGFFELGGDAEKVGTVYLVHFHTFWVLSRAENISCGDLQVERLGKSSG